MSQEDDEDMQDCSYDDASDYESDEEDDADAFAAPPVRAAEVPFRVFTPAQCEELARKEVAEVVELLCCDANMAQLLLRTYNWNRDKLTDAYMSDPDKVAAKAGVWTDAANDRSVIHSQSTDASSGGKMVVCGDGSSRPANSMPPIKCSICYETSADYSALACGHPFCNDCYSNFLGHKIADEGHACFFARCPEPKCQLVVSPNLVLSLVTQPDALRRYQNAASLPRSFVDDSTGLKWCPAPNCNNAVQALRPPGPGGAHGVQCSCEHRFCFGCMQEDHAPASCADLQKWMVKCRDDSETYNWLMANTKACPKCQTSIEKNGGCNHMTCKKANCKYEFCWVCEGPWKDHSGSYYNCNKYDPDKDKAGGKEKKDSSRAALERYLHYYTRFTNHHNSLKFEIDAKSKMEQKIKDMEKLGDNTWMDCLYLNEANDALFQCRYTLKFTYVFAFYLPREDNFRYQFENQQTELERQTEELAELLEKDVAEIQRMDVVHCYKMALKRLSNLMELVGAQGGYENGGEGSSSNGAGSSDDPITL